jgi:hypothetical protein
MIGAISLVVSKFDWVIFGVIPAFKLACQLSWRFLKWASVGLLIDFPREFQDKPLFIVLGFILIVLCTLCWGGSPITVYLFLFYVLALVIFFVDWVRRAVLFTRKLIRNFRGENNND